MWTHDNSSARCQYAQPLRPTNADGLKTAANSIGCRPSPPRPRPWAAPCRYLRHPDSLHRVFILYFQPSIFSPFPRSPPGPSHRSGVAYETPPLPFQTFHSLLDFAITRLASRSRACALAGFMSPIPPQWHRRSSAEVFGEGGATSTSPLNVGTFPTRGKVREVVFHQSFKIKKLPLC